MKNLLQLPEDVLCLIVSQLSLCDRIRTRGACRVLRDLEDVRMRELLQLCDGLKIQAHKLASAPLPLVAFAHRSVFEIPFDTRGGGWDDVCVLWTLSTSFERLEWASEVGILTKHNGACFGAATMGDADLFQWLLCRGARCDDEAIFHAAALEGHTHLFQPIVTALGGWNPRLASDSLHHPGALSVLRWVVQQQLPLEPDLQEIVDLVISTY